MPMFPVKSADELAAFIIPVTTEQANTMIRTVNETGHSGYFAVYGTDGDGKPGKWAIHVRPEGDEIERWYYVILNDYHPRKDGKATIEFKK